MIRNKAYVQAFIALIIIQYLSLATNFLSAWWTLKIVGIKAKYIFEDSLTVLTAAKCYKTLGFEIYNKNQKDPFCFYPYGHKLLDFVNFFNLDPRNIKIYATFEISIIILVLTAIGTIKLTNRLQLIIQTIVLISPPTWLLYSRANIDGIIFCFVVLSALFLAKRFFFISFCLITLTTLMKFYTFPLLLTFPLLTNRIKQRTIYIILISFTLLAIYPDIKRRELVQPGSLSFGAPVFQFWTNAIIKNIFNLNMNISVLIGTILGNVFICLSIYINRKFFGSYLQNFYKTKMNRNSKTILTFLGMTHISCFMVGMNYDYRLIFLIGAEIILIPHLCRSRKLNNLALIAIVLSQWLTIFSFGLSGNYFLLIQWFGILIQFELTSLLILICWNFISQEIKKYRNH